MVSEVLQKVYQIVDYFKDNDPFYDSSRVSVRHKGFALILSDKEKPCRGSVMEKEHNGPQLEQSRLQALLLWKMKWQGIVHLIILTLLHFLTNPNAATILSSKSICITFEGKKDKYKKVKKKNIPLTGCGDPYGS
jgi:hypothetical protein